MTTEPSRGACCYCERSDVDLRPYGPGGAEVCFKCAMSTPEREQQTGEMFIAALDRAGPIAEQTSLGPRPLGGKRKAQA